MPHTFTNLLVHFIFSTKDRRPYLDADIRPRVFAYMGGVFRELGAAPLLINGPDDHVHALASMPASVSVAEAMRVVKTNSSRWVHEQWTDRRGFAWQSGYGAFSVSQSNRVEVERYIANQEEHHRHLSFQDEFLASSNATGSHTTSGTSGIDATLVSRFLRPLRGWGKEREKTGSASASPRLTPWAMLFRPSGAAGAGPKKRKNAGRSAHEYELDHPALHAESVVAVPHSGQRSGVARRL